MNRLVRSLLFRPLCQKRFMSDLKWSYVSGPSPPFPLRNDTLGQLVDMAEEKYGSDEAVVSVQQGIRKSFSELTEDSYRLARAFSSIGLNQGDMVGIWSPNNYEWLLTQLAASIAGCILVSLNPAFQTGEIYPILKHFPLKAIVSLDYFKTQRYYDIISEVVPELKSSSPGDIRSDEFPHLKSVVLIKSEEKGSQQGTFEFQRIFEEGGSAEDERKIKDLKRIIQADDICSIQFTSGTTGVPKGVCLSHNNIINNTRYFGYRLGFQDMKHRINLPVPLFHCYGCVAGTLLMLCYGATCVYPSMAFDGKACIKAIKEEKCTVSCGTPTMYVDMIQAKKELKVELSGIELGISAGAILPEKMYDEVMNELNIKVFQNMYGCTETGPISFMPYLDDPREVKFGTVGYPAYCCEVKVVDPNGKVVPVNTIGELCVRSQGTMLGYYNEEKKTKDAISWDNWYHSGDQATIDENGYGRIVGRTKDMIIRGGENIYPKEIENILMHHPDIIEAYIVGTPDERMGEELCAWIRLELGVKEVNVKEFCHKKISHFKIPKYVMYTESFPKTVSGKIQKFKLEEWTLEKLK